MIELSPAERLADDRDKLERQPFLTSHRALAACSRELERFTEEVLRGVAALHETGVEEKPVVRLSPGRCIVQLGPVALTVAWLRSTLDSVASGELLVIIWRGTVAPRRDHLPERTPTGRAPLAATALWEEVLTAAAASEVGWSWMPKNTGVAGYSSAELAARCVKRLGDAYAESRQS